jgi:hypothetical protein
VLKITGIEKVVIPIKNVRLKSSMLLKNALLTKLHCLASEIIHYPKFC